MAKKRVKKARANYKKAVKTSKPGEGKRWDAMVKLAKAQGAKNPEAVAGKIFWEKYGKKKGSAIIKKAKKRK